MKNLEIIGGIIALLTYIPLGLLVKKEPKIHSFASWAMFAVLDYITAWMLWSEGGNWLLVLFLALGCTSISILLLYARAVRWGAFESFTLLLVFLVCIVWIFYGNTIGAIAGIIANVTAGAPQFKDSWKIPDVRLVPIGSCLSLPIPAFSLQVKDGGERLSLKKGCTRYFSDSSGWRCLSQL